MLTGRLPYGAQIAKARTRSQFNKLVYARPRTATAKCRQWIDGTLEGGASQSLQAL
jgi:hypothetical protein